MLFERSRFTNRRAAQTYPSDSEQACLTRRQNQAYLPMCLFELLCQSRLECDPSESCPPGNFAKPEIRASPLYAAPNTKREPRPVLDAATRTRNANFKASAAR